MNTTVSAGRGDRPLISLVVPCTASDVLFIPYMLRSVNYQTYLPAEVIIAVSGIEPKPARQLELQWRAEIDQRVALTLLDSREPAFAGPNRQRGGECSRSEIISFFDADDVQAPCRLEKIADAFTASHVKAVFHRFTMHRVPGYPEIDEAAWYNGALKMYHRGWISVRRRVIQYIRWGDEPRSQDFHYLKRYLDTFGKRDIAFLPEFLGHYVSTGYEQQNAQAQPKIAALQKKLADYSQAAD
ncbi:MAG: glycosyltransferase family 2 protein [Halieaceae bacterium]|jgi:hypothetical protein|nr:glycosyltransferase family 2 protein [Halieaceae bacterium]